ncbi:MAG TPA: hypothetical protein VFD80_05195, partial [Flavobacteriaceae bacterium]|nr:hypothetical protein [Flavobacteriaceae bacterium]
AEPESGKTYPNLMFAHGEIPDEAPQKEFTAETFDLENEFDDFDLDDEDLDSLGYDENWN